MYHCCIVSYYGVCNDADTLTITSQFVQFCDRYTYVVVNVSSRT